jgi:serine/threonine protein kinase
MQLADFGLSRIIDLETRTHVSTNTFGTITYMPPELLTLGHLTKAADVYSFGIIMAELYSGQVNASLAICYQCCLDKAGQA